MEAGAGILSPWRLAMLRTAQIALLRLGCALMYLSSDSRTLVRDG